MSHVLEEHDLKPCTNADCPHYADCDYVCGGTGDFTDAVITATCVEGSVCVECDSAGG